MRWFAETRSQYEGGVPKMPVIWVIALKYRYDKFTYLISKGRFSFRSQTFPNFLISLESQNWIARIVLILFSRYRLMYCSASFKLKRYTRNECQLNCHGSIFVCNIMCYNTENLLARCHTFNYTSIRKCTSLWKMLCTNLQIGGVVTIIQKVVSK